MQHHPFNLRQLDNTFDLKHGFLPNTDPIIHLPVALKAYDDLAYQLPKLITNTDIKPIITALPEFDLTALTEPSHTERAMLVLSFIAHSYVWSDPEQVPSMLPAKISQPWHTIASQLGRPPVLSYASYALYNWYRIDKQKPIELGNIALLQNFMGGIDEEWFILIHIDIEAKAIGALRLLQPLQTAITNNDILTATTHLCTIAQAIEKMGDTLERMEEYCDPYIYFHRVRPFINGWHENPALPKGLIYEGVDAYQNQPQQFKGETGAQSTIIPSLDAVLNIHHQDSPLKKHLDVMQEYMPFQHREFLQSLQHATANREWIIQQDSSSELIQQYNRCIEQINRFRQIHLRFAGQYINKQVATQQFNAADIGTGGTPFMQYLKKHQLETEAQRLLK